MEAGQLLWQPARERLERSQMYAFMTSMARRYSFPADYPSLHRWSVEHRDQFWQAMLEIAGIEAYSSASAICTGEGMLGTRWFPGMKLNYAAHLLRHEGDRIAIAFEDELGRTRSITRQQLRDTVARCRTALQRAGVSRGDRIGGFLPNLPESVIAMLATASLGAVWSSCSPDFGIRGVLDRFGQIEPKVLFAADAYSYGGKKIDSIERVASILEALPSVEQVVVIPYLEEQPDLARLSRAKTWPEFLTAEPAEQLVFDPVPFDHPLFIMYSSGTTGVPKCIIHGHGGTLLQHMKELMLHCDLRDEESIFYFTTCGWMMWNWVVSSLGVGATLVTYEGSPAHPDMSHLWQMAERRDINVFGTSPKYLSACQKAGARPGPEHDLSKLRCLCSTGSPLSVEQFEWVYTQVKADLQLSSISGGTDLISCFMLGNPILPVHAGEVQCLGLGMDVKAFNDAGQPVIGDKGELVCCSPFPSRPLGFWNDDDQAQYRTAYYEDFEGVWRHGDYIEIKEHGGVVVLGRSDATLNPGGVRIGTAEIYRAVEALDEVVDSVVVGKDVVDDIEVCLFVVLRDRLELDEALQDAIKRRIAEGATKRHVPRHIRQVSAIPYTISGKKVELAVRQMIHGQEVGNRDALGNPEALEEYRNLL